MKKTRTPAAPVEALFLDDLPDPRAEQFRMRRLQVHNWGTFSGLHTVPIAERGFLFVGRSGSGKSTLLDAMSALLVPPALVDFNAAAREAERSGRDRNLVSYVRGAWADRTDADSGEIATQYLRRGATWSALVLEYRNALGRTVSLVRLFWIAGAGSAAADVRKHYMVCERRFDIAGELEGFDLDLRRLKARLGEDVHHFENFAGYAERFRRVLGIGSEMALKLLHKTQSAKNLGDLNHFLRSFMLEVPDSFAAADRLVADFADLDAAHRAVVAAREQVDVLAPAREDHQALLALRRASGELLELRAGIDAVREQRRLALLDARLQDLATRDAALEAEEGQRAATLANHEALLADLERQHLEQGGDRIVRLEQELARVEAERDVRTARRRKAEDACRELDWDLPGSAQSFAEAAARARDLLETARARTEALDERIAERRIAKRDDERRFAEVRAEIAALEQSPSNIPSRMQALRARLCEALGLQPQALPFAGELMQVREDEAKWRGAAERLLHGFALSLLVDERHHAAVARWVDETHLGTRLVYHRIGRDDALMPRRPGERSLVHKLELADHPHREWLQGELARRFDYACVDSPRALAQAERAVTREGQVKHGGSRYEKDDRHAIGDRSRWVLGFDNREKRALFEKEARELARRIGACESEVAAIGAERQRDLLQVRAAQTLADLAWDDIDVAPRLQRIADIRGQLDALRSGDATLRALGERIEAERAAREAARRGLLEIQGERVALARERSEAATQRARCAEAATVAPTPLQAEGLAARLGDLTALPLTLNNIESRFREIDRALVAEIGERAQEDSRLAQRIETAFREFRRRWPEDAGDFTPDLSAADDYLARLRRLELDGLPRHEARFFELLQTRSKQNLTVLQRHLGEARKAIGQRLDEVNASLEQVPFNRGTVLTIELTDRRLPEVLEFQQRLREVLAHHQTEDRALAEAQFGVLRALVARLGADDPEARRWREQVLDVRLHVEFHGVEIDAQTHAQVEVYRSGAGKSGGQRQKLATTCLAAALRYQLGGEDGGLPRYAAVVLDEAFDKADNEFTALAMNIFENFGFQMIVATPLKSVMTLEPFIGGACFVEISGRHDSGTLLIEYDDAGRRLKLPERARRDDALA
ncbi:ATP-binding protein [Coralloluteibacterium thermophilus]|uniref:ATP-binding protein n=1 Tax=Coralloluteibacterium thermophilum TaxID=2707049 RepID=A0ABV9NJC9_9GAMM